METLVSISLGLILIVLAVGHYRRLPLPPTIPRFKKENIYPWQYYRDWSLKLGPLISLPSYGAAVVVINTIEVAVELLERRKIFACRPRWPMVELLGRQDNIGFTYYGERLKKMRKLLRSTVFTGISEKWGALLDDHSAILCRAVMESPASFYEATESVPQQLITHLAYGQAADEDYIRLANKIKADTTEALQPGRWLINLFPTLKYIPAWVPGAGFKRWAEEAQADFSRMMQTSFYEVKEKHEHGVASYSFVRECLEQLPEYSPMEENIIMSAAASLFTAGTETITGTILVFIALILRNGHVQERAYQEIIGVVGTHRLPQLEDRKALPYVNAIIQEVQRFHPAVPLVAHGNTEEDHYDGWRIPKKTWVIANIWAILHDETMYPNPDEFDPGRFFSEQGAALPDPAFAVFGFGRRRCPGAEFANTFLYLVISRMLALFKISSQDPLHPPPLEFGLGLVSCPKRFICQFSPRSNAEEILNNHKP